MRILIIEDEDTIAEALRKGLEAERYSVSVTRTGEEGYNLASTGTYDIVLLDLTSLGRGRIGIMTDLRLLGFSTPVLILSSKDMDEVEVKGLDMAATDFLMKPFAFCELLARIRTLLRLSEMETAARLNLADLEMDVTGRSVVRGGQKVPLTRREFDLLENLLRHQGPVVSREMLARDVWNETMRFAALDDVIDA